MQLVSCRYGDVPHYTPSTTNIPGAGRAREESRDRVSITNDLSNLVSYRSGLEPMDPNQDSEQGLGGGTYMRMDYTWAVQLSMFW